MFLRISKIIEKFESFQKFQKFDSTFDKGVIIDDSYGFYTSFAKIENPEACKTREFV